MKNPLSQRGTGAFTLVEFLCVVAILGVLALAVLAVFWHHPVSTHADSPAPPANFSAQKIPPQNLAAVAAQINHLVSAPASSAVSAMNPKPPSAFDDFSSWVKLFTNSSASLVEGERLAWKRREAMLDLIQNDPKKAIE